MFAHTTVLKTEAVEQLNIDPGGTYVDCTLGGAGHSYSIASQLNDNGRLIALDQDKQALEHARTVLQPFESNVTLIQSNFRYIANVLNDLGITSVNGVLYDLGVSSPQLDDPERGFSYQHNARLDMRMDEGADRSAYDVVNTWSEGDLADVIYRYGEERFARVIAKKMVEYRNQQPIETTFDLVEIIKDSIPAPARRKGPHPAKRTFQAIRIAVNDELQAFEQSLEQVLNRLSDGGRICVITFHSLEDRICTQWMKTHSKGCVCPPDFPQCVCGQRPMLKRVTKKPIVPRSSEIKANNRARSAKLRVAEKIMSAT